MADTFLRSPIRALADEWNSQGQALPDFSGINDVKAPQGAVNQPAAHDLMPPADLMPIFQDAARRYGVPVNVLMAMGQQESRYRADAVGQPTDHGRAKGMMQYLDNTASGMGINPFDPAQAIDAAARQYRKRIDEGYTPAEAVQAHFGGDDRKLWGPKTRAYGEEVMQKAGMIGQSLTGGQGSSSPIVDEAKKRYPILQRLNVHGVTGKTDKPYLLEFWGPNEPGGDDEKRPDAIPKDAIGVQIFGKDVRPIDVLADVTSHYLVRTDPTVKALYNQFVGSITPEQKARLKDDYQWAKKNEGESRPFDQWVQQVRLPAYFRGYTFDQWPESFTSKLFTPDQIQIFDKVRGYLGVSGDGKGGATDTSALQKQLDTEAPGRYRVLTPEEADRFQSTYGQAMEALPQAGRVPKQTGPELRAWKPTLWDRVLDFIGPNRDRAAVEAAARQVAKEDGVSVDDVYKSVGGHRALFNPEGRAPLIAATEAAKVVAKQAPDIIPAAANTVLRTIRGGDIHADPGLVGRWIEKTDTQQPAWTDPNYDAFQNIGESLGFSLLSMAASAVGGAIGSTAGPGGTVVGAMAGGGGVAYRAMKDQFLSRVKENLDEKSKKLTGKRLSEENWQARKEEFESAATKYGAWEAIPEAVSNLIFLKALAAPLHGASDSLIKNFAHKAADLAMKELPAENITETATNLGQNKAEREAGLTDQEMTLGDAFRQQVVTTMATAGFMSGGGAAVATGAKAASNAADRANPARVVGRELNRQVEGTQFTGADEAARRALDPNSATAVYADASEPVEPVPQGPIGRSMQTTIDKLRQQQAESATGEGGPRVTVRSPTGEITGTLEGEDGAGGVRVLGDDGMMYQFSPDDGVEIVPEEVAQTAAPAPAEQAAPSADAGAPVEPTTSKPKPAPSRSRGERANSATSLEGLTEEQLRERLKYLAQQAKANGGWNGAMSRQRQQVEKLINAKVAEREQAQFDLQPPAAAAETTPTAQPQAQEEAKAPPAKKPAQSQAPASARLPKALSGAKPRYAYGSKQFTLSFDSDVDRAAYITAQKNPSKRDAEYLRFVQDATGMTEEQVRAHGARVRNAIRAQAKNAEPGTIRVPAMATESQTVQPAPEAPKPTAPSQPKAEQSAAQETGEPVKWFGSQDKAQAWIDKQKDGGYRIEPDGRRFNVYRDEAAAPAASQAVEEGSLTDQYQSAVTEEIKRMKRRLARQRREPETEANAANIRDTEHRLRVLRQRAFDDAPDGWQPGVPVISEGNEGRPAPAPAQEKPAAGGGLIVKRDGTPFASEAVARRAMTNRRLKDHEPVQVEGGWALAPVAAAGRQQSQTVPIEDARRLEKMRQVRQMGREARLNGEERTPPDHFDDEMAGEWLAGYGDGMAQTAKAEQGEGGESAERDLSAGAVRNRRKKDKAFKAAFVHVGEPHVESGPAAQFLQGWLDADAGKPMDEGQVSRPSADMRPNGFNPVDFYRSGYLSKRDGEPVRVRALDTDETLPPGEPTGKPNQAAPAGDRGESETAHTAEPAPTAKAKPEASKNTIFTDDAAEKAREVLRRKLTQVNSGIDPEIMQAGITLAGYHIERGARTFAAYAKAMVADLGDGVRPYLKSWYLGAKFDPRTADFDGMSSAAKVEVADVDEILQEDVTDDTESTGQDSGNRVEGTGTDRVPGDEAGGDAEPVRPATERRDAGEDRRGEDGGRSEGGDAGQPGVHRGRTRPTANTEQPVRGDRGNSDSANGGRDRGLTDYRIRPGELKRDRSWKGVAERNVDIVELTKRLEAENREATPEEKRLLTRFTGWGASEIANGVFPDQYGNFKPGWQELGERLKAALTPEEYAQAKRSTQYAHYTSEGVIRSIYDGLERLGFAGGNVLEPGMGIGLFRGLMPDGIAQHSTYTGVEYDTLTGQIAGKLYPESNVIIGDYSKTKFPKDFFDAAIGNPPFSSTKITNDPEYRKHGFMLHDYFFAKTLDRVKPGGLVVFVTSKGTMDKANNRARKYMAERANLVGAVRLPQTAFKDNAGTEVVTDVLFLQKRGEGVPDNGVSWLGTKEVSTPQGATSINEYFADHPAMVLGDHALTGSMYRANEYTVVPHEGVDIEQAFNEAVKALPENVYRAKAGSRAQRAQVIDRDFNPSHTKEGGVYLDEEGGLRILENGSGIPLTSRRTAAGKTVDLSPKQTAFLTDYVKVRGALKQAQFDQLNDGDWESSLAALNSAYDAFRKTHGPMLAHSVTERENDDGSVTVIRRFKNMPLLNMDVESALTHALEHIQPDGTIVKGPVLLGRTLKKPVEPEIRTTQDALFVSLNQLGHLDLDAVAELAGTSRDDVIKEMGTAIYNDPASGWMMADQYLSGNVVAKLREAEAAAKVNPAFKRNVEALKAVQPHQLGPADITVQLGSHWVPASDIRTFASEVLGEDLMLVNYSPITATWNVDRDGSKISQWGFDRMGAGQILDSVLNNRQIRVTWRDSDGKTHVDAEATEKANDIAKKMREAFKRWIWQDADRADRLSRYYNEHFNNIVPRQFDGSHLTLPGVSLRFKLFPHQKRAIWRAIQEGNTYFAHSVGAGKTFSMIAAGMEEKRLGLSRKPMYVVPNHMLAQFSKEFLELYPTANIMVADEQNFHTGNRRRFVAQAALNDPDAIIITHSAFGRIGMSEDFSRRFINQQIDEMKAVLDEVDKGDRITRKQLERRIEQLERRLEAKQKADSKDKVLTFEEMGVDRLFIDEAHEFRKLDFATNRGNVKGIDPSGSQKSMDLAMKVQYLEQQNPGRSLVMASGTPVTNTMGELYTVQRFFQAEQLAEDGLSTFDAWSNHFGEVVDGFEQNAAGGYEVVARFAKFVNVPDLMSRVRTFMDILTSDQLGELVQRPSVKGGQREIVVTPVPDGYKAYQKTLNDRIKDIRARSGPPQPGDDIILKVIADGRFSAIDMRFVDPSLPSDPKSKLNQLLDAVIAAYHETAGYEYHTGGKADPLKGGSLMVFTDLGLGEASAKNRGFDMKAWIEKRLVDGGVKREHLAFMRDNKQHAKKERLFADMREGKRRILIGGKDMETGVNAQKRLTHLFHLDAPWFPASVEQREGRIIRQGNQNKEVAIKAYATKGSYDSTMWGMNARKARFIEQAMTGDTSVRAMEDVSEASSFEMASALASGDERYLRLAGLKADVARLDRLYSAHLDDQRRLRSSKRESEGLLERLDHRAEETEQALKKRQPIKAGEFSGEVEGQAIDARDAFGEALFKAFKREAEGFHDGEKVLGHLGGFDITYTGMTMRGSGDFIASLDVAIPGDPTPLLTYPLDPEASVSGIATRAANQINRLNVDLDEIRERQEQTRRRIEQLDSRIGSEFQELAELTDKRNELNDLESELAAEGADAASEQGGAGDDVKYSVADPFVADFLMELAANDEMFQYPKAPGAATLEGAFRQVDPTVTPLGEDTRHDEKSETGADTRSVFKTSKGRIFYVYQTPDEVWIDVSHLEPGDGGNAIYQAVAEYAINTDREFIGDPAGLTDAALRRRTENMQSSALKHGTTRHLKPHPRQREGNPSIGVPPLQWRDGDHVGNILHLIEVSTESLAHYVPEIRDAYFDFKTRTFRTGEGEPLTDGMLRAWSEHPRIRAAGAGSRTLKRGILLNTLSRTSSSQRPGLLESILRQPDQFVDALKKDWYSVSNEGGLSRDELLDTLRSGPLAKVIDRLIDRGKVVLHRTAPHGAPAGAQAATDADGTVHLFADALDRRSVLPVLLHEAFHSGTENLIGSDRWNALQRRLGALYRQGERSTGKMNTFWQEARQRIKNAERAGDRMNAERRTEEFGAYAIENYARAPRTLRQWVDDLVGAVKAWFLRRFGVQVGHVTPPQLRALALATLRQQSRPVQSAAPSAALSVPDIRHSTGLSEPVQESLARNQQRRYSVSDKNAAINMAQKGLKAAKKPRSQDFDGGVIRDLGSVANWVQHPYTIASMHEEFTPVFTTAMRQSHMRDQIISDFYQDFRTYRDMPEESRRRVNQVLELGRLTEQNFDDKALAAGITNPGTRTVVAYDDSGRPVRRKEPLHAALSKKGDIIKLSAEERAAYQGLRGMFDRALSKFADQILIDMGLEQFSGVERPSVAILKSIDQGTPQAEADRLMRAAETMAEIEQAQRTGYVPLSRYGRYAVTVKENLADLEYAKNPNGGWIVRGVPENMNDFMEEIGAHYDEVEGGWQVDRSQRQALNAENSRTVYSEKVELGSIAKLLDERRAEATGAPISSIRKVREAKERIQKEWVDGHPGRRVSVIDTNRKTPEGKVRLSDIDALADLAMLDQDTWAQIRDQFSDVIKGRGFRKHFFRSDNVPGYSTDFERAIGDYIGGMAGHLSRRRHERQWEDSIAGIKGRRLHRYASEYRDYVNNPAEEFAMMRQTGFLMYIAGNLSTAAINATQTHLMAVPAMAQFAPAHLVNLEVARAYKDALKMTSFIDKGMDMFDPDDAPADVRDVVRQAWDEGAFSPLFTHEVMGHAGESSRGAKEKYEKFIEYTAASFTYVERMNRLVTYIAAARLAQRPAVKKKAHQVLKGNALARHTVLGEHWSPKNLGEFVVNESQFLMGKANRAKMFRGSGSLVFQFMSFVSQALQAWYRWSKLHGVGGKMMTAASMAAITALSGLWGFPGLDHLRAAYESAYLAITGEDKDLRTDLRQWVYDVSGSVWLSEVASKGALYPMGVDVSNRIGFQRILPDAGSVVDLFGVQADLWLGRPARAWAKHEQGDDYAAIAELAPNFVKNPVTAYDWSQEGVKNSRGKQILTPEQIPESALWWKAAGFQPTIVNDVRDYLYAQYRDQTKLDKVKDRFLNRLAQAIGDADRNNDPSRKAELEARIDAVFKDIDDYNDSLPDDQAPIVITNSSLNSRINRNLYGVTAQFGRERRASRESAQRLRDLFRLDERLMDEGD